MFARWRSRVAGLRGWRANLAAVGLGALAAAALPPVHIIPVLWISVPGLLVLIEAARSPAQAAWRGWWFGVGHHVVGLYWVTEAILIEAARFWWFVPLAVPALAAVLALITAVLLGYIIEQRIVSREINSQISEVEQQLASLDHEKTQAQVILNRPANRVVADQSRFLNNLFARKALSWTRVFTEMERIMPYNIHVVSMKPDYSLDNQLLLHMVVATDSRDRAVELVQRMEKSSHFRQAQVVAENVLNTSTGGEQGAAGGNIQFEIAAFYIPGPDDAKDTDTKDENGGHANTPATAAKSKSGTATQAQNQRLEQGHH